MRMSESGFKSEAGKAGFTVDDNGDLVDDAGLSYATLKEFDEELGGFVPDYDATLRQATLRREHRAKQQAGGAVSVGDSDKTAASVQKRLREVNAARLERATEAAVEAKAEIVKEGGSNDQDYEERIVERAKKKLSDPDFGHDDESAVRRIAREGKEAEVVAVATIKKAGEEAVMVVGENEGVNETPVKRKAGKSK